MSTPIQSSATMARHSEHHHHHQSHHHFLLLTAPGQGHINPALQFAKRVTHIGASVTYLINLSVHRRMTKSILPDCVTFVPFSDGYDDGFKPHKGDDYNHFASELQRRGSQALADTVRALHDEGRPVTCIVYTTPSRWVYDVAGNLGVASVFFWTQPATVFDVYYFYFNGYKDAINGGDNKDYNTCYPIQLPGLPLLTSRDTPPYLSPSNNQPHALSWLQDLMETLRGVPKRRILVNTFNALEADALRAIDDLTMFGIGPLIPSAFLDEKDPSDTGFGGDMFHGSNDYVEWLNGKPKASVVYVSFGSFAVLKKPQMEAIARGLLEIRRPFLWIIRQDGTEEKLEDILDCIEELRREGKIVPWCSQLEVLSHPSVGCFLTHSGWNSTLESLVTGAPVVALPQWGDQMTNAKLIEDVWRTGVRAKVNEKEGIVEGVEIRRCLEMVMEGEKREEMIRNAHKWKNLAKEAAKEGGSADRNLQAFMDELSKNSI